MPVSYYRESASAQVSMELSNIRGLHPLYSAFPFIRYLFPSVSFRSLARRLMLCYAAVHPVRRQHQALQAPPIWQLSVITAAVTTNTYSRIQQQATDGTTMMAEADMSTIEAPPGVWWTYDNDESMRAPPGGVCLALLSRFNCQLVVAAAAAAAIVDYRWTSQERRSRGGSLWELESRPPSVRYRKGPRYDLSESTAAAACGSWSLQHWTCADVCMLICQYCSY